MKSRTVNPTPETRITIDFGEMKSRNSAMESILKGQTPSNSEIERFITEAEEFLSRQQRGETTYPSTSTTTKQVPISSEAQLVIADTKRILESLKTLVRNKNDGEELQHIVKKTQSLSEKMASVSQQTNTQLSTEAGKTLQQVAYNVLDLARRLLVSAEFRTIILDIIGIMQSLGHTFTDELTEATKTQMAQLPQPQPSLQEGMQKLSVRETYKSTEPIPASTQYEDAAKRALDRGFSDEKLDELTNRIAGVLSQLRQRPEYQNSISGIFYLIENLKEQARSISEHPKTTSIQNDLLDIQNALIEIFKDFSDRKRVEDAFTKSSQFVEFIRNDQDILEYYQETRCLVVKLLQEPESFLLESRTVVREHIRRGQTLFNSEDKKRKFRMINDILVLWRDAFKAVADDPDVQRLSRDAGRLTDDFTTTNAQGGKQLDWELLGEMKTIMIPMLLENLRDISIPKIEGTSGNYDFILRDIRIIAPSLVPENIKLAWNNNLDLALRHSNTDKFISTLTLRVENITAHIDGIQFWFRHNTTPKMEDKGVMDVHFDRKGMSITIVMQAYSDNKKLGSQKADYMGVRHVDVDIDRLTFNFREAKHDTLYSFMAGLFKPMIRSKMEGMIEQGLTLAIKQSYGTISTLWESLKKQSAQLVQNVTSGKESSMSGLTEQAKVAVSSLLPGTTTTGGGSHPTPTPTNQSPQKREPFSTSTPSSAPPPLPGTEVSVSTTMPSPTPSPSTTPGNVTRF